MPFACACSYESLDHVAESAIAPIPQVRSLADTSYTERGSCEFLYHGKRYSSTYTVLNDSICEYDNKEVREFIESHTHQKELHVFVHNNGQLEYFDTEDEMTRALESEQKHKTRSSENPWDLYRYGVLKEADLELYEDSRWKGKALYYHLGSQDIVEVADLGAEKFDNKLSAFRLNGTFTKTDMEIGSSGGLLTFYLDTNFQSFTLNYSIGIDNPNANHIRLKEVKGVGPFMRENWNDKVSSFRLKRMKSHV